MKKNAQKRTKNFRSLISKEATFKAGDEIGDLWINTIYYIRNIKSI